ncbi:NAD-dependent epimerase/dehydratase family protein [Streptomyces sp. NPDC087859]|uniref:NAD-dependent epimerase/dehydratase family protein n=1 Tax=Streptomyces sp. NPDC087859 TaxID=3365812 RepID=UPI0038174B2D
MTGAARHVLVTGASGYIGGAVAHALLAAGHRVTGLVRDPSRAARLAAAGADLRIGDMLRPQTYVPLVQDADAVVHAAQLRFTGRLTTARIRRIRQADAVMAGALAEACRTHGRRLLYASGAWVYGDHGERWIDESVPHRPAPLGVWHAAATARLRAMAADGLDSVVLHAGFVYGPGGNFRAAFADQASRSGRIRHPGDGSNHWSCVHLDDLAAAYVAALERAPAGAEYNIADDEPLPLARFAREAARALGAEVAAPVPRAVAALALGRPVTTSLTTSYRLSNALARDELGWRPAYPTVADGLPSAVAALRGTPTPTPTSSPT